MNDPELLLEELAAKSISNCEIVLPYDEVFEAIEHLVAKGYFVFAWEGWIKYSNGRLSHSVQHQGTVSFWGTKGRPVEQQMKEAALFVKDTIQKSQQQWNNMPEVAEGTLYFCLSIDTP